MKYCRICLMFVLIFFLSGCSNLDKNIDTIYYNLDIGTTYKEKINIYLPKNAYKIAKDNQEQEESFTSLEYKMLYENIEPIFSEHNAYYQKKIDKRLKDIKVTLEYNYIEDEFIYSNYIMNCFENYKIITTDDKVEIALSGEFYCLNDKDNINIKVSSIFDVINSNGLLEDDNYIWNINSNNYKNVNINHVISRNYVGMIKNKSDIISNDNRISNFDKVKTIILAIVLLVLLILKKKIQKNNNSF